MRQVSNTYKSYSNQILLAPEGLVYGKYTLQDKKNPAVYAYTRELDGQKLLIVLNFSANNAQTAVGINTANAKVLLSNYPVAPSNNLIKTRITLRPYEAIIYKL